MAEDEGSGRGAWSEFPESVEFTGVGNTSLLQVHISAGLLVLVGVILAVEVPPAGLVALALFLLIVLGFESWMIRRSQKRLRLSLRLRSDPVEAFHGGYRVGVIDHGTVETEMDDPNDLGYRPLPKKDLIVWTFDSVGDKEVVARRLLEYLPRDGSA